MNIATKNPNNLPLIDYRQLVPTQGDLKDLSKDNYQKLLTSFKRFDFFVPVFVWKHEGKNKLIDGHQRLRVLTKEGIEFSNTGFEIPSLIVEADNEQDAKEKLIAISSQIGTITYDGWYGFTAELPEAELLTFANFDKLPLLGEKTQDVEEDEPPEVSKDPPQSVLGAVYQLGRHRVMCGDSTGREQVERLMDGKKADLFITDPPYGVSYADKNETLNSIGRGNRIQIPIKNDHMSMEQMGELWTDSFTNAYTRTKEKSPYYINAMQGGDLMMMMDSILKAGWNLKHMMIWAKNNHVLGRMDYHYQHEPIFYGWKEGNSHNWYGDHSQTSLWEIDKPLKSDLHPTMKPVVLVAKALKNSSQADDIVLDLFGGSGSTLIACEQLGRTCFMMELDPAYVDVIRKRYAKFMNNNELPDNWAELTPAINKATI